MANGLSKLIKRARKANETNILARLAQKRFRVEELEDRIAPAAIAALDHELVAWDADSADLTAFTADGDGAFVMFENDGGALQANLTMGDTTTSLTDAAGLTQGNAVYVSFEAATLGNNTVITIATNGWLGDIDLSNLTIANGNTATINIVSGADLSFDNDTPDEVGFTYGAVAVAATDIAAYDDTISTIGFADADNIVDGPVTLGELGDGFGIGTITLPTVATGESATLILNVSAGTADGAVASADGDITAITDTSAGTLIIGDTSDIYCDDLGSMTVDAIASTFDISGSAGDLTGTMTVAGTIGTLNIGSITSTGSIVAGSTVGALTITNDLAGDITATGAISSLTVTDGGIEDTATIRATQIGAITVDLDESGTNEDIAGTITATTGSIGHIKVGSGSNDAGDISGTITAATSIEAITLGNELAATGSVTAGTTIGAIIVNEDIAGSISAGGNITSVTSTDGSLSGSVTTTGTTATIGNITIDANGAGNLSGTITSIESIGNIQVGNDISGTITADTSIGTIETVDGSITSDAEITAGTDIGTITVDADDDGSSEELAGTIEATAGGIGAILVGEGDLSATITSGTTMSTVTVGNDLTGTITSGTTLGALTIYGDISGAVEAGTTMAGVSITGSLTAAGTITSAGNATGDIQAANLLGAILIGGDLDGSVISAAGIADLTVTGVVAPTTAERIDANGGAVVATVGAIKTAGGALTIEATTDITLTVNGTDYDGTLNGAIEADNEAITITADSADTGTADNGGDVTIITNYIIGDADGEADDEAITINGDDISITVNNRATALDTDATVITTISADGNVTFADVTGDLTVASIVIDYGALSALTVTGDLSIATLTVSDTGTNGTGTIGNISAEGTLTLGTVSANDGIGTISSVGDMTLTSITATTGNIGAITAGDADNDSDILINTKVEATAGSLGNITTNGTGDVYSGGSAILVAGANVVSSGVIFQVTDRDVIYKISSDNATAGDSFAFTWTITDSDANADVTDVEDHSINLDINRNDAVTAALNLSIKTSAMENGVEVVNDQEIDVSGIDFVAADVTADLNKFGTLTIDGDITGTINLGADSSVGALILQGDLGATFKADTLSVIAAATVNGGTADATAANLDEYTTNAAGTADPAASPINGTFIVPASDGTLVNKSVMILGVGAAGTTLSSDAAVSISVGAGADNEATVVFTSGVFTSITGATGGVTLSDVSTATNLSTITGTITINGDVSADLTLADTGLTGLIIKGAVSGNITAGVVTGDIELGVDAGTMSDVTGTISFAKVTGDVDLGNLVGATITIAASDYTVAGVTNGLGGVTINDVDDTSTITLPELANASNVVITEDMLGTLNITNAAGAAIDVTITEDFGSEINITGSIGVLTLNDATGDDIIGSDDSVITATGSIGSIVINEADDLDSDTVMVFKSDITTGSGALSILGGGELFTFIGDINLGTADGAGDFAIDLDASGAIGAGETYVDVTDLTAAVIWCCI